MTLGSLEQTLHTQRLTGGKFSEGGISYVQKGVGYSVYKGDPYYNEYMGSTWLMTHGKTTHKYKPKVTGPFSKENPHSLQNLLVKSFLPPQILT